MVIKDIYIYFQFRPIFSSNSMTCRIDKECSFLFRIASEVPGFDVDDLREWTFIAKDKKVTNF